MNYNEFIESKTQLGGDYGFEPVFMPPEAFPFQEHLIRWAVKKGRAALFADCGLGKTLMQLAWAQNVAQHTSNRVLILTPLAVSHQTVLEAKKFNIEAVRSEEGELNSQIIVTNYERLHYFKPSDFAGVVCDESSILKHFGGATQKKVTRFMNKLQFRLLCTATAAPNDYTELGTSSEALGELSNSEMLTMFFRQFDDKGQKSELKKQALAEKSEGTKYYQKLSFRVSQSIGQWRLKNHAVEDFWRWVASWARACRAPSDLGFSDDGFDLPALTVEQHTIEPNTLAEGMLLNVPAFGLSEEREERKRALNERCEYVRDLASHDKPVVVWCHSNAEGDMLEKIITGSRQIAGRTPDDEKIEIYRDFAEGKLRVLVIKPKIGAWGLNWQHCSHVITFGSHSYEQYYQSVRRCWRFGQKHPVKVDVVCTTGEDRVLTNLQRKSDQAEAMFKVLVEKMNDALRVKKNNNMNKKETLPSWL